MILAEEGRGKSTSGSELVNTSEFRPTSSWKTLWLFYWKKTIRYYYSNNWAQSSAQQKNNNNNEPPSVAARGNSHGRSSQTEGCSSIGSTPRWRTRTCYGPSRGMSCSRHRRRTLCLELFVEILMRWFIEGLPLATDLRNMGILLYLYFLLNYAMQQLRKTDSLGT